MSKAALALKTASQTAPAVRVRPSSRTTKTAEVERRADEQFWAGFREWHEQADSLPKRRAYLRRMCRRIAETFQPEKIILFGSYAYGGVMKMLNISDILPPSPNSAFVPLVLIF